LEFIVNLSDALIAPFFFSLSLCVSLASTTTAVISRAEDRVEMANRCLYFVREKRKSDGDRSTARETLFLLSFSLPASLLTGMVDLV
jgi:hypothetical protein